MRDLWIAPAVARPVSLPSPAPAGTPRRPGRRWPVRLLVAVLLAQMAFAMVTTAVRQTPTIDEPVYVGAAAEYVHEHRLRHNPEHPPLGKLVIGVGVALADPHVDPGFAGDQGQLGRHLLYESGNDPWRLMLWARLPVIALTLSFGLVVFAFARELAGPLAGLAALALYCFSPDVIAHGSLATLDVPAAGSVLTSAWLVWRARRRPRLYVPLAGPALGAALATKMSTLPAVPVLMALAAVSVWKASAGGLRLVRAVVGAGVVALTAITVVWVAYLMVDPRLRWTPEQHVPVVHGLRGLLVRLLPFPEVYRDGMRVQFGLENRPWQGFLFGRLYDGSLWYYLPSALLVKTPLGMLALWVAGAAVVVGVRRLRPAAPYVLAAPLVLLAAAMQGARDFGTRYAVFLPLFLAVAAGCVCSWCGGGGYPWGWPFWWPSPLSVRRGRIPTICPTPTRRSGGRAGPGSGCTTRTWTGGRTSGGSRTGSATGTRVSGCGSCTRAAGCRPSTASRPRIRDACRSRRCGGCWSCRTRRPRRPRGGWPS